jgi:hypothetical protein
MKSCIINRSQNSTTKLDFPVTEPNLYVVTAAAGETGLIQRRRSNRPGNSQAHEPRGRCVNSGEQIAKASSPKEKVAGCRSDPVMKTLRFLTEGASSQCVAGLNPIVRRVN